VTGMLGSCRRDAGPVRVDRIGMIEYVAAWEAQRAHAEARRAGTGPDVLMLLEHHSVYTAGKRTQPEDRPTDGTPVIDVDRGGRITWHGPGQLVGYPIVAIDDVMAYVARIERAIVTALEDEGIAARGRSTEGIAWTGVWVEDRKLASIGLHVSQGVAKHGFAVNVDNSLDPFGWIVPCGLPEVQMTSVAVEASEGGRGSLHMACFRKRMAWRFAEAHGARQRLVSRARLEAALERAAVPA